MNIFLKRTVSAAAFAIAIASGTPAAHASGTCAATVFADVVAVDQHLVFNRWGARNPVGMIYALRQDVVDKATGKTEAEGAILSAGNVRLRDDKRPRPIVLRVNEGDCLQISFQNLLSPTPAAFPPVPERVLSVDRQPATRTAGMTIQGVSFVNSITDGGANVGRNPAGLVAPGATLTYTIRGEHEGVYEIRSQSDNLSGEGIQGVTSFGLFGALNVEKKGSEWYRSTTTRDDLELASRKPDGTPNLTADGHPIIDYNAVYPAGHRFAGQPILKITNTANKIVHNELNAVITGPNHGDFPAGTWPRNPAYPDRDKAFREFTVVFHDETETVQAFPIFRDPAFVHTLGPVKDGFMINYASAAVGTEVVANRLGVGPSWDCPECKFEEFFLTSWAVSDPGILVDKPANDGMDAQGNIPPGPKATKALYPADTANVFHTYIGDRTKIRNLHVGKEFHIFHLHAQQWLFSPDQDGGTYLDAQGLGPGSSYSYEIAYNSGNRNLIPGDAIFHCHFYPHFAQGMWALYRNHDVFEMGTKLVPDPNDPLCVANPNGQECQRIPAADARALPDGEIVKGTPIPAIIPIPTNAMAPLPGKVRIGQLAGFAGGQTIYDEPGKNSGYPFNLGQKAGHRPASPPLDLVDDGGLPRHIVRGGGTVHSVITPLDFSKELLNVQAEQIPETGNTAERAGMAFHAKATHQTFKPDGTPSVFKTNGLPPAPGAPFADPCRGDFGGPAGVPRTYKGAVIQFDMKQNKLGHHFPQSRILTLWGDAQATVDGTKPPEPFFIRANTNDCVSFYHTNLVPGYYELDDFQVRTPTDIIGQHIHLVKFDVTSSDGSANGFNYEDGTMSPDEVRERIHAINTSGGLITPAGKKALAAKPHPYFGSSFNGRDITGARTTIQRWYVDNLLNTKGEDRTLGNVFTHDHFGPSTHQQTGLYATFITEPQGSRWRNPETGEFYGTRFDGGPTSWRADILMPNPADSFREFMFQIADFALAYEPGGGGTSLNPHPDPQKAINPPGKEEVGLPFLYRKPQICPNGTLPPCPMAISAADDGGFVMNYRNEPVAERVRDPRSNTQAPGAQGDLAMAYSSAVVRSNPLLNVQPTFYPPLTAGVGPRDPYTPLMRVYENDKIRVRLQVGATEESHNASINGVRWLQEFAAPNSGFRNSQHGGISEQFNFDMPLIPDKSQVGYTADYLYALNPSADGLWLGTWGILRSYALKQANLLPLPNNNVSSTPYIPLNNAEFAGVCPTAAPLRRYDVSAVAARDALPGGSLVYNARSGAQGTGPLQDPSAVMYVHSADLQPDPLTGRFSLKAGVPVEPLVLRAAAGDCIDVTLRNRLPQDLGELPGYSGLTPFIQFFNYNQVKTPTIVGLHPQLVEYDITRSDGSAVGNNPSSIIPVGGIKTYRWYAGTVKVAAGKRVAAPVEFGATALMPADRIKQPSRGAVGALIIEPQGSTWVEDYPRPHPNTPLAQRPSRTSATVTKADGTVLFREQALVYQNDIPMRFGNNSPVPFVTGMEDSEDTGVKALNYRTEPIWFRVGYDPEALAEQTRGIDFTNSLSNVQVGGDPETPVFSAKAGEQVRLRLVHPGGHVRNHVFALQGHIWQREPYVANSTRIGLNPRSFWRGSQDQIGPSEHFDVVPDFGAGGAFAVKGDYLFRDMLPINFLNGWWGIMRVE